MKSSKRAAARQKAIAAKRARKGAEGKGNSNYARKAAWLHSTRLNPEGLWGFMVLPPKP